VVRTQFLVPGSKKKPNNRHGEPEKCSGTEKSRSGVGNRGSGIGNRGPGVENRPSRKHGGWTKITAAGPENTVIYGIFPEIHAIPRPRQGLARQFGAKIVFSSSQKSPPKRLTKKEPNNKHKQRFRGSWSLEEILGGYPSGGKSRSKSREK